MNGNKKVACALGGKLGFCLGILAPNETKLFVELTVSAFNCDMYD